MVLFVINKNFILLTICMALNCKNVSTKHMLTNKLTKIKRLSKKLELRSQIINSRHNNKKFWSIINTLTPQKAARKSSNSISVDGKIIKNSVEIAEKFYSHFCSIGKKLSDSIDTTKALKFNVYLSKRVSSSMCFRPVSTVEVFDTIN